MLQPATRCLFTEGSITLPAGYFDQTVNVYRTPDASLPAYSITRDRLPQGATLAVYIKRQLDLMEKHLPGWQQPNRDSVWLGERQIQGELIVSTYQREGKMVCQQQAIFEVGNAQILVFTQTKNFMLTEAEKAQFNAILASFSVPAA